MLVVVLVVFLPGMISRPSTIDQHGFHLDLRFGFFRKVGPDGASGIPGQEALDTPLFEVQCLDGIVRAEGWHGFGKPYFRKITFLGFHFGGGVCRLGVLRAILFGSVRSGSIRFDLIALYIDSCGGIGTGSRSPCG